MKQLLGYIKAMDFFPYKLVVMHWKFDNYVDLIFVNNLLFLLTRYYFMFLMIYVGIILGKSNASVCCTFEILFIWHVI